MTELRSPNRRPTSRRLKDITALLMAVLLGACSTAAPAADSGTEVTKERTGFLDSTTIHTISVDFEQAEYEVMIDMYATTGEKDWIAAVVTIDGITYSDAGIRLKGNSSLRGLGSGRAGGPGGDVSADEPENLPWLIRLDKSVDGQNHGGISELVVRSNNSETALNEAVALELLDAAGLASQESTYAAFSVNGGENVLRLVMENPDDVWLAGAFDVDGVLYKAEATGDYSYRGDDPDAYDEVFDIEAGEDNGDLTPLIEFLDFINNADDDTFNDRLPDLLDVDAFATYLAVQELIDNFDDIDGPGNNSYLFYDVEAETFTVVPWDHNLAFGGLGAGGDAGDIARPDGVTPPEGFTPPDGFDPGSAGPPGGVGQPPGAPRDGSPADPDAVGLFEGGPPDGRDVAGGPGGGSNILVERFLANDDWQAAYEEKLADLRESLYDGGLAGEVLAEWVDLLETQSMVDIDVVHREAGTIEAFFSQ